MNCARASRDFNAKCLAFVRTVANQFGFVTSSLAALVDDSTSSSSVALRWEHERNVVGIIRFVYLVTRSDHFIVVILSGDPVQVERFKVKIRTRIHWKKKCVSFGKPSACLPTRLLHRHLLGDNGSHERRAEGSHGLSQAFATVLCGGSFIDSVVYLIGWKCTVHIVRYQQNQQHFDTARECELGRLTLKMHLNGKERRLASLVHRC